ncbi:MAG TPA: cytochrome c oxidase assembly protein [Acidimicrobiales bacterium]|nr:cytochrome c oxidase assembly protein [Acidimicrobiales bacterium]
MSARLALADVRSPAVRVHTLLTGFQHDPLSVVALAVEVGLVVWYLGAVRRLARRGRRWSPWRTASFVGASALVMVAVQSGLAAYDDEVFTAHVVQHLLLMNLAPILFALSAPMTLALQAAGRPVQQRLLAVLHHRAVAFVTRPVFVAIVAYGTMIGYFLTPFYGLSLEHTWLHDLSHLHFLVSGCLFWWLVVGRDPSPWRLSHAAKLGLLAVGIPVNALLGLVLTGSRVSVAPAFHTVADTHRGGSVLWIVGELITLVSMAIVVYQWLQYEQREAIRADRRLDALEAAEAWRAGHEGIEVPAPAAPVETP